MLRVLNLGAGVQSTTVYLMYLAGEIQPGIDCAVFADTGEEPAAVYSHLHWLQSLAGPPIIVRSAGRLGDDLMQGRNSTGGRFASIPAYTAASEGAKAGIIRRQCTKEYKVEVIERYIRREILGLRPGQRIPKDVTITQAYGISLDEAGRSVRIRERLEGRRWITPEFPLIVRGMTRGDCLNWLRAFGVPHEVQKSACVFCPFKSNAEWRRLRDTDRDGWARACQVDNALRVDGTVANRKLDQKLYVHRSCVPLERADLGDPDPRQYHLGLNWTAECAGMCGV
ncbi:MAG: hypothetical protein LC126_09420 [Bryobacterales bacterium]|nr:hypothetical protein [Bryobacterales bacterium]